MTQQEKNSNEDSIPDLQRYLQEWSKELDVLRQNHLLDEAQFISFARERDVPVTGLVTGDPGEFHKRGWLTSDGEDYKGELAFHPFRVYPLHQAVRANNPGSLTGSPTSDGFGTAAQVRNKVVDLAILLEPVYWPIVTGQLRWPGDYDQEEFKAHRQEYKQKVNQLIKTFDKDLWQRVHTSLRLDAAKIDENDELYLLLRLSNWNQRKKLIGRVSLALWFRHIAEVIRRAFEEAHSVKWAEEDQAFGAWSPGGRRHFYGSERPLDDVNNSKPYLAFSFGLFTGSAMRWYVEGDTEFHSILHIIPDPSKMGVELINLRGNIGSGKDNTALKVNKKHRRFSMISIDLDVKENVKFIKRQVEQGNIVGYIAAHKPDFEFANFTVEELAEVVAGLDESYGKPGEVVRNAEWKDVHNGRAFEEKYMSVSVRKPRGLKGKEWGEALAAYADVHPNRSDSGSERPFWTEIRSALQGRVASYDFQQESIGFDPETFQQIDLRLKRNDPA